MAIFSPGISVHGTSWSRSRSFAPVGGCGPGGGPPASGSENSDLAFTGITINAAGAVPGTNAPYLQLVACRKN